MSSTSADRAARAVARSVRAGLALIAGVAGLVALSAAFSPPDAGANPPRSFYGVTTQVPPTSADFNRMQSAHAGAVRTMLSWSNVEQVEDAYTWTVFDDEVLGAAKRGIRMTPFVYTTPTWVAESLDGRDCSSSCVQYAPRSPAAIAEWKEFLVAAVARYGPGGDIWAEHPEVAALPIVTWQISNEQNSPKYFPPRPRVARYAEVLKAAGEAIHGASPESDVVIGGMFGTPFGGTGTGISAWDYLRKLYRIDGIKPAFDGIALHPYAETLPLVRAQIELALDEVRRAHDAKVDLWITEIGWASGGPRSNWLVTTPKGQAQNLRAAFKLFEQKRRAWNIRSVFWYSWRDLPGDGICLWCPFSGLLTKQSDTKPAYRAFRQIAR